MIPILNMADAQALKARVMNRSQLQNEEVSRRVKEIVTHVREEGDAALFEYTARFDKAQINADNVLVSREEIDKAYEAASPEWLAAMREAAKRITAFHEKQKQNTWINFDAAISLGQKVTPLSRVGVYVPGGTAAYPSSVLMNVLPAKVAGVKEIVMVTPPGKDGGISYPLSLVAADIAGVDKIYKIGGAQAVAALAFGTESIPRVDKITGPGNIYVANAKREVFGHVGIDMVAGPSEVLVIADDTADPRYVAADLLSQAEHDPLAAAILVTDSAKLADAVDAELARQTALLPRREVVEQSLSAYGTIVVAPTMADCADIANQIAPEHLELSVAEPYALLPLIENAGAIFMGHYSPEPLGDYLAGPNHVLPTSGTARFFSPLSVDDFVKKSSLICCTRAELERVADQVILLAQQEGLDAHANSVAIRFGKEIKANIVTD
ncbi:MAG: histidinol dehydrogenase [Clostridia bacterium]|nr:histidinol dehydrogenase [Clostridia bacterium]